LAFVADFGTQIFHLKNKFDMENNTSINRENSNGANRLLYAVPPERTMELCKAVLDYLGSRLNQDIEPKPSLNSVACLAADIMKELRKA
jgi:hypothetical protein